MGSSASNDLRARRQRVGLNQRALACLANCQVGSVRAVENGWRPAEPDVLQRIERVLSGHEAIRSKL
jgi:transcriptional regulator with XRE-family HTH domain